MDILIISTQHQLLADSIKVSDDKVDNDADIGFVKNRNTNNFKAWDDDWSK